MRYLATHLTAELPPPPRRWREEADENYEIFLELAWTRAFGTVEPTNVGRRDAIVCLKVCLDVEACGNQYVQIVHYLYRFAANVFDEIVTSVN